MLVRVLLMFSENVTSFKGFVGKIAGFKVEGKIRKAEGKIPPAIINTHVSTIQYLEHALLLLRLYSYAG